MTTEKKHIMTNSPGQETVIENGDQQKARNVIATNNREFETTFDMVVFVLVRLARKKYMQQIASKNAAIIELREPKSKTVRMFNMI